MDFANMTGSTPEIDYCTSPLTVNRAENIPYENSFQLKLI